MSACAPCSIRCRRTPDGPNTGRCHAVGWRRKQPGHFGEYRAETARCVDVQRSRRDDAGRQAALRPATASAPISQANGRAIWNLSLALASSILASTCSSRARKLVLDRRSAKGGSQIRTVRRGRHAGGTLLGGALRRLRRAGVKPGSAVLVRSGLEVDQRRAVQESSPRTISVGPSISARSTTEDADRVRPHRRAQEKVPGTARPGAATAAPGRGGPDAASRAPGSPLIGEMSQRAAAPDDVEHDGEVVVHGAGALGSCARTRDGVWN